MRALSITAMLLVLCRTIWAQPASDTDFTRPSVAAFDGRGRPAGCAVIYDAELGQAERETATDAIPCFNVRYPDGLIRDALVADDFQTASPGRITDAFLYVLSSFDARPPSDGVRLYLWGSGETPAEQPSAVVDVPPAQVHYRSLAWWERNGFEIHATGLDIPYPAGRNWITIQPRDWAEGATGYHALRNYTRPLQGVDAFVRDGPDAEHPAYGFTDWRRSQDAGFGFRPADSYIRLETCDGPRSLHIVVEGACGGPTMLSWSNARPATYLIGLYARNTGTVRIPGGHTCSGTQLGLGSRGLREVFRVITDGSGSGSVQGHLSARACPGVFQAVAGSVGPCQVSNVVETP